MAIKLIYDDIIYSLQKSGGISLYWSQLEKYLRQDIRLLYKNYDKNIFYQDASDSKKIIYSNIILFERIRNIVLDEKSPFIFHSSYYRYCRNNNAVNITTVHDYICEYFRHDIKSVAHKNQKNNAIKNSHGVICNSNNTKKDLLKYCPDYKGITKVIYLGLSEEYKNLKIPRKDIVIFIGARLGYKNFLYAIELLKKLPELKLQIIGGGSLTDKEKNILQNTIPDKYEYFSSLNNDELNLKYNEAKFLLYPSLYEGFGIPIVEAQAAGCPVVCCNVSSLPEITGDAALYISGKDIKNDINTIRMLDDPTVINNLIKKGFENCLRFSWEKCAEETYDFYNEIYNIYAK